MSNTSRYHGIENHIGKTPLIRLRRLSELTGCEILGKAEFMNPGGSVKDRAASNIVKKALRAGYLGAGKALLDSTSGNTGIAYAMLGAAYFFHAKGTPVLALVLTAMACYCCTLAPVTWVILSEIFPNRIRGAAMSVSVFALWVACFLLSLSFPIFRDTIGPARTFWIYSVICILGFFFILARLPETKGKTLEQIERELVD